MILYNVPGRTVADLSNDTAFAPGRIPNIIGIRTPPATSTAPAIRRPAPQSFALYTGDDMTAMAFIMLGGHGTISVTANVAPRLMHELCVAAAKGDGLLRGRSTRSSSACTPPVLRSQPDPGQVGR